MPTTDEDEELSPMHKAYIGNEWLLTIWKTEFILEW
jgi:hypothetical protein